MNSYVVSFPEYSQLFVELFQKLYSENDGKERESVLTVYSHLYTYSLDKEKNNEILKKCASYIKSTSADAREHAGGNARLFR